MMADLHDLARICHTVIQSFYYQAAKVESLRDASFPSQRTFEMISGLRNL